MMQVPIETTLGVATLLIFAVTVQSQMVVNQTMIVEGGQNNTNTTIMPSTSTETTTVSVTDTTTPSTTTSPETSSMSGEHSNIAMGRANDPPSTNQSIITTTSTMPTTSFSSSSSIQNVSQSSTTDDLLSLLNISDGWMPGNFPPPKSTTRDEAIMTTFVSPSSQEPMVENTTHVHGFDPMTSSEAPSLDIHAEDHLNSSNLDKAKYDVHHGHDHGHDDHEHDHSHHDHDHGDDPSNTDMNETKSTTVGYSKEVAMDGRPRTSNARSKQADNSSPAFSSAPALILAYVFTVLFNL